MTAHCTGCHRGGLAGPFALTSYEDAAPRHLALVSAIEGRRMPPWLPDEACRPLHGGRALSSREIDVVRRWSLAGTPAGDPSTKAIAREPAPRSLAWVDRTLDAGVDFTPRPTRPALDEQRCFLLDPTLAADTFLVGYDLTPTYRAQVLRAVLVDASIADARTRDDADPGPGWACNDSGGTDRVLARWAGAFGPVELPKGSGVRLQSGRGIVLQLDYHVHETSLGVPDRTKVSLAFARDPITREVEFASFEAPLASVPPRTTGFALSSTIDLPAGGTIWAIEPHMRLLGRRIRVAIDVGGQKSCLLDVPRWDYHWEQMFFLAGEPVVVPTGAKVDVECVWDNPTALPRPKGPALADETCEVAMILTRP